MIGGGEDFVCNCGRIIGLKWAGECVEKGMQVMVEHAGLAAPIPGTVIRIAGDISTPYCDVEIAPEQLIANCRFVPGKIYAQLGQLPPIVAQFCYPATEQGMKTAEMYRAEAKAKGLDKYVTN